MNDGVSSRRGFIRAGVLTAGTVGLALAGLHRFGYNGAAPVTDPALGPLVPVNDLTTGLPLLSLPEGFRYHTFSWAGETMSDGFIVPGRADGMGLIQSESGMQTLVRNHELRGSSGPFGNVDTAWDNTGGGTTTLVFDTENERLDRSFVSLNGTMNNCAGGVTPWGTWLSCEEAVFSPAVAELGIESRQAHWDVLNSKRFHGYVFEVGPEGVTDPEPLWDMGQFWHEAAAVDPNTGIVYLTEDRSPHAGLYRFLPKTPGKLNDGGRLQMLKVEGFPGLTADISHFSPMPVGWVDIDVPGRGHTPGTHDGQGVVSQGIAAGGSTFRALEGCDWYEDQVFFTAKNSGAANAGYVFRLNLGDATLELIYEAPGKGGFSGPDNIKISPGGNLVICEDRGGMDRSGQYLARLDDTGMLTAIARVNPTLGGQVFGHDLESSALTSEWAGVCFSPDGQWMFANVYSPGFTCAITGPWPGGSA